MKNTTICLLISLFLISCGKQENGFDSLSEQEKQALRARSERKCLATSAELFNNYKEEASQRIYSSGSSSFDRHSSFKFEYKEGDVTRRSTTLQVWKQNSTDVYFYVRNSGDTSKKYFLRIPHAVNEEMIDDLQKDFCAQDPKVFSSTSAGGNGPVALTYEFSSPDDDNKTELLSDRHSFSLAEPVYFGSFRISRNRQLRDSKGNMISGETKSFASTFTDGALANFTTTDYTNGFTQEFCEIVYQVSTTYRLSNDPDIRGYKLNCVTTLPAGWDLSI